MGDQAPNPATWWRHAYYLCTRLDSSPGPPTNESWALPLSRSRLGPINRSVERRHHHLVMRRVAGLLKYLGKDTKESLSADLSGGVV